MKVRALDSNWDWEFGKSIQSYKSDEKALAQHIKSRILSFFGDCFFDMDFGINWFQLLGYRTEEALKESISNMILSTDGVVGLNSVELYKQGRTLFINYDIKTIYSTSYKESLTNEIV